MSSKMSGGTPGEMIKNAKEVIFSFPIKEAYEVEKILNIVEKETKDYDPDSENKLFIVSIKDTEAALKIYEETFENRDFKNKPKIQCVTSQL